MEGQREWLLAFSFTLCEYLIPIMCLLKIRVYPPMEPLSQRDPFGTGRGVLICGKKLILCVPPRSLV